MDYLEKYEEWCKNPVFDEKTREELLSIKGNDAEIKERFYQDLEFGTGGLRGIIGAGTNRMNIYTVGKATQGLANFIKKQGTESKGVAIAYDSRHKSQEFSEMAALCLNANGIKTYRFESLRPTPELSFAVRELRLHSRNSRNSKPQSTRIQWIQSILGRWSTSCSTKRQTNNR